MSTTPATEPTARAERLPSALSRVVRMPAFGPTFALLAVCLFFALKTERFFTGDNISLIFQQTVVIGILAIGQTIIILTAGIDLSCGAVMAFGTIVMTKLVAANGVNVWIALLLGILACVGFGLLNGILVTNLKLPPFIVTLGTFGIAIALTTIYSNSETFADIPRELTFFGETFAFLGTQVSWGTVVMLGLFALAWYLLTHTAVGRRTYALGDNPEAVRLAGVHVSRLLIGVYAVAGLCYGIAGYMLVGRTGVGDPAVGITTENLDSITAVVIGGTSLFGGRGAIVGTLIGALIVSVFRNGLILLGVESSYQVLVTGILVILAVAADQLLRGRVRA